LKGKDGINDHFNRSFKLEGKNKLDLEEKYTMEEMIDRRVRQMFGDDNDFDRLIGQGALHRFDATGKYGYNYYYWPGNKTRHPIYFERLKKSGDKLRKNLADHDIQIPGWHDQEACLQFYQAVPVWITPPEMTSSPEYDMYVCNWKTSLMRHGTGDTQQNAWLAEIRDADPYELYIWINTKTAESKGFQNGDEVCLESKHGKAHGKLKLTELIHPEVLGVPGCYGSGTAMMSPEAKKGTHYNRLLSGEEETNIDPISGSITISPKVKVFKSKRSGRTS
jgi:anaerobic selenocysteine-containing dehydrogenase